MIPIQAITKDEKLQRTLRKKLKGKYEKGHGKPDEVSRDGRKGSQRLGLSASEVVNWGVDAQVLKAAEWSGTPQGSG